MFSLLKASIAYTLMLIALNAPLSAEIERITINWNPQVCLDGCVREITKQLSMVPGIAEIMINQPQGQSDIRWKPKSPFSYDFLRNAVGMVGSTIRGIRVQVRGTLVVTPGGVFLESLGDNTKFVLLSPAQQSFTRNVPQLSFDTHILTPQMRQQLIEAAKQSVVAVVKGPLLQPGNGLYLIIEQISFNRLAP